MTPLVALFIALQATATTPPKRVFLGVKFGGTVEYKCTFTAPDTKTHKAKIVSREKDDKVLISVGGAEVLGWPRSVSFLTRSPVQIPAKVREPILEEFIYYGEAIPAANMAIERQYLGTFAYVATISALGNPAKGRFMAKAIIDVTPPASAESVRFVCEHPARTISLF